MPASFPRLAFTKSPVIESFLCTSQLAFSWDEVNPGFLCTFGTVAGSDEYPVILILIFSFQVPWNG
jgi:hypothetical protein